MKTTRLCFLAEGFLTDTGRIQSSQSLRSGEGASTGGVKSQPPASLPHPRLGLGSAPD